MVNQEKRLEVFVTFKCNNNCLFCIEKNNREKYLTKKFFEDQSQIEKAFNHYKSEGYGFINLLGGEPFLAENILKILEIAKAKGFIVSLATNGARLADKDIAKAALPLVDELIISIHGHNQELITQQSQNTKLYDSLLQAFDNIRDNFKGRLLKANTVINKINYKSIDQILMFIKEQGINEVNLTYMDIDTYCHDLIVPMRELNPLISTWVKTAEKNEMTIRFAEIPFCVLGDNFHLANNLYFYSRDKILADGQPDKIYYWKKHQGEECKKCKLNKLCTGLNLDYYKLYGDNELKAVI